MISTTGVVLHSITPLFLRIKLMFKRDQDLIETFAKQGPKQTEQVAVFVIASIRTQLSTLPPPLLVRAEKALVRPQGTTFIVLVAPTNSELGLFFLTSPSLRPHQGTYFEVPGPPLNHKRAAHHDHSLSTSSRRFQYDDERSLHFT